MNETKTIAENLAAAKAAAQAHENRRMAKVHARTAEATARQRAEVAAKGNAFPPNEREQFFLAVARDLQTVDPELTDPTIAQAWGLATKIARGYEAGRARLEYRAMKEAIAASQPKRRVLRDRLINLDDTLAVAVSAETSWVGAKVGEEILLVKHLGWLTPTEAAAFREALAHEKTPTVALFEGEARFDLPAILHAAKVERTPEAWLARVGDPRLLARWAIELDARVGGIVVHDPSEPRGFSPLAATCWSACGRLAGTQDALAFWRENLPRQANAQPAGDVRAEVQQ